MQHLGKGKSLALKICDTFEKTAVKNPCECLFSCGHVIVCDFLDFVYLLLLFFWSSPQKCSRWTGHATTAIDEVNNLVEEDTRVARLFLFADWPEKYFSGQLEGENSNASGTGSVRVSAQGLSRSCCKLSAMKIPSSWLATPGSPRMGIVWPSSNTLWFGIWLNYVWRKFYDELYIKSFFFCPEKAWTEYFWNEVWIKTAYSL